MGILRKFTHRNRIRKAARALALDPSPRRYVNLAREYVVAGSYRDVLRVCTEGLEIHTGNAELRRMAQRAKTIGLDKRIRTLQRESAASPRPALYKELCEVALQSGKLERAEEVAKDWYAHAKDGESTYFLARVCCERFFADRRKEEGQRAFELTDEAQRLLGNDPRPLQLQLELTSRTGAWQEARKCIARLLELTPGDPDLEARFRTVLSHCDNAKSFDRTLNLVERTGQFIDDRIESDRNSKVAVRPMLQKLSADQSVRAAVYLRGGTALVQGPHGATADRTARTVRDVVQASRSASRRLGLGRPVEVLLEGSFGSLLLSPGEGSTSAVWCDGAIQRQHEELLRDLSGMAGIGGAA
jgi:tetratricopeptide (TPR) repeat protein